MNRKGNIRVKGIWKCTIYVTALILFSSAISNAQNCAFPGSLGACAGAVNPIHKCIGETFCVKLTTTRPIVNGPNWSYSGSYSSLSMASLQCSFINATSGGVVTASGIFKNTLNQNCPFTITLNVFIHNPSISVSPNPIPFTVGTNVAINATPVNATAPTFNWQPNNYFVSGTNNTVEDPVVSPPTSTTYDVTVTDAYGCINYTNVDIIANTYAKLTKTPEGGYYSLTTDSKLLFMYDAQYANTSLKYYVFDKNNTIVADYSGISATNTVNSLVVNSGDNRYYLNASTLGSGYYTLQVINEKNEKHYLRFLK